jgi:hypothetical protein
MVPSKMTEPVTADEQYLLVEEVADRLGLPLAVLLRRVEAGDIPARRIENENGVHYSLRLADLGIEPMSDDGDGPDSTAVRLGGGAPHAGTEATFRADAPALPDAGEVLDTVDITGRRVTDEQPRPADEITPTEPADHREPAQRAPGAPPSWLQPEPVEPAEQAAEPHPDGEEARDVAVAAEAEPLVVPAEPAARANSGDAELAVPPPSVDDRRPPAALLDTASTPHGDLAVMSLDARELVAGLLDRWERTLEQRIYTEQRQRFQGELTARQTMVKQLQMELHTARAEHAAAQADKDRSLAEKERELADRERDLADARRLAEETERLLAPAVSARRRRRFWQRTDV